MSQRVVFTGCSAVWAILALLLTSNVGVTVLSVLLIFYGSGAILVVAAVVIVAGVYRRKPIAKPWLEPSLVVVVLLLIYADVPFHVRFLMSRQPLERYVTGLLAGKPVRVPQRVGLFTVAEAEILPNSTVRLITTDCMFDECGLVFSDASEPPVVGEDSYRPVTTRWWRWWRSW